MAKLLTNRYIWPDIRKDVATYVRNCESCKRSKVHRHTKSYSRHMWWNRTVADALLNHWIFRFGVPSKISSDRDRRFESAVFNKLTKPTVATHLRTTTYHSQVNRIRERFHRTLKTISLSSDPNQGTQLSIHPAQPSSSLQARLKCFSCRSGIRSNP